MNRVWANYFGVGIINPPDDSNLANPPSNAPLLSYLTEGFIKSGYDMKWLHREIANSDTYQRSWQVNATNQHDERNFSKALVRRLPAEAIDRRGEAGQRQRAAAGKDDDRPRRCERSGRTARRLMAGAGRITLHACLAARLAIPTATAAGPTSRTCCRRSTCRTTGRDDGADA